MPRVLLVVALLLASFIYLAPTFMQPLPSWWPSFLPKETIRLGLDLQGGIHLVLQVEVEKAVENAVGGSMDDLKRNLLSILTRVAPGRHRDDAVKVFALDEGEPAPLPGKEGEDGDGEPEEPPRGSYY